MGFDEDIALRPAGAGAFGLDVPAHWRVGRAGTNGGYVAAAITAAVIEAAAEPERQPRSLTIHYLAGCQPGPARIAVAEERSGRSLTTLSARLTQGDSTVALALATLGRDRPGLDFAHLPMPEAPPPEQLEGWTGADGRPAFSANWDYRPCLGSMPYARAPEALSGGWIRPAEPSPLDAPRLAAMADAWIPPVFALLDRPRGMVPTIDLTVHFRAALPPAGVAPGDFSLAAFASRLGAEGYCESDGVIWSRDGRVLAQVRQLGLFNLGPA